MQNIKQLNITNKTDYRKILYILLFSVILSLFYNFVSIDGIELIRNPQIIQSLKSIDIIDDVDSTKHLKAITLAQAIEIFNSKKALFVDARDQWDFAEAHIKGAINIPEFSFNPNNRKLAQIPKNQILIIYCSGDACSVSKRLTSKLLELGYLKSYVYLGGMREWLEAKLPIEKASKK